MAYTANIPQASDAISVSQGQILANFQALAPCVGGIFANQAANLSTGPTDIALFNKVVDGIQALCIRDSNNGNIFPLTDWMPNPSGYAFLPSGLIVKFGNGTTNAGGTTTLAYNVTYPFTALLNVQFSLSMNAPVPNPAPWAFVNAGNPLPLTQIQLLNSANVINFYYFAIGTCASIP